MDLKGLLKIGPIDAGKIAETNLKQGKAAFTGDLRSTVMNGAGILSGGLVGSPQPTAHGPNADGISRRPESPQGLNPQTQQLLNRSGYSSPAAAAPPTSLGGMIGGLIDRTTETARRLVVPSEAMTQRVQTGIATTSANLGGAATSVREAVSGKPSALDRSEPEGYEGEKPAQPGFFERVGAFFGGGAKQAPVATASAPPVIAREAIAEPVVTTLSAPAAQAVQPIAKEIITAAPAATISELKADLPAAPVAPPASTIDTSTPAVKTSVSPKEDFTAVAPPTSPALATVAPAEPARRFDNATYERAMSYVNSGPRQA